MSNINNIIITVDKMRMDLFWNIVSIFNFKYSIYKRIPNGINNKKKRELIIKLKVVKAFGRKFSLSGFKKNAIINKLTADEIDSNVILRFLNSFILFNTKMSKNNIIDEKIKNIRFATQDFEK